MDSPSYGELIGIVGGEELRTPWPIDQGAERTMELRRMSVHVSSRGLGLATHLVDTLEGFARDRGFARVVLTTGMVMKQAQLLYEACGYEEVHREVYKGAKDPETEGFVAYVKRVQPIGYPPAKL